MNVYHTKTAKETMRLAKKLLPQLIQKKLVLLSGPLGSGKTTFVKGLAKALGIKKLITSPTYTYLNCYEIPKTYNIKPKTCLYHFDFYRLLENTAYFPELEESTRKKNAFVVVEWPERLTQGFNSPLIKIEFKRNDKGITITVRR